MRKIDPNTGQFRHPYGSAVQGLDMGPSTIAIVGETQAELRQCAAEIVGIMPQSDGCNGIWIANVEPTIPIAMTIGVGPSKGSPLRKRAVGSSKRRATFGNSPAAKRPTEKPCTDN